MAFQNNPLHQLWFTDVIIILVSTTISLHEELIADGIEIHVTLLIRRGLGPTMAHTENEIISLSWEL